VNAVIFKPLNPSVLFDTIMEVFGKSARRKARISRKEAGITAALKRIKGAKILLVEDNEINQQVATELLENAGLIVTVADNGREAVESVLAAGAEASFDAILMDLQMPEMDGYAACRNIRKDARFKDLPIIAMTAHAMADEREKCLNAGMNDHATKPIDPLALFATLTKWVQPGKRDTASRRTDRRKSTVDIVLPEHLPGIDVKDALSKVSGNKRLFIKLIGQFRQEFGEAVDILRQKISGDDLGSARRFLHNLKGVSGNLGALALSSVAQAMEGTIEQSDKAALKGLMKRFETDLKDVLDSAAKINQAEPSAASMAQDDGDADIETAADLLRRINTGLGNDELIEDELIGALKKSIGNAPYQDELERLERHITAFDYDEATSILNSLATSLEISL
jgi:CheY-like chemotaxis protein